MIKEINSDTFAKHIVGMMVDNKVTMFDALLWDFETFCGIHSANSIYEADGLNSLERRFRVYLVKNGIRTEKDEDFYTDIFMGRSNNMGLVKDAKEQNK